MIEQRTIDIQISHTASSEGVLHRRLQRRVGSSTIEPGSVDGAGGATQNPGDSRAGVCLVHDVDLGGNLGVAAPNGIIREVLGQIRRNVRYIAAGNCAVFADDVEVDLSLSVINLF